MGTCKNCDGGLRWSRGTGRWMRYRDGNEYEIPSTLEFDECEKCDARYLSTEQARELTMAFEQRAKIPNQESVIDDSLIVIKSKC